MNAPIIKKSLELLIILRFPVLLMIGLILAAFEASPQSKEISKGNTTYELIQSPDSKQSGLINQEGDTIFQPIYDHLLVKQNLVFLEKNGLDIYHLGKDTFLLKLDQHFDWEENAVFRPRSFNYGMEDRPGYLNSSGRCQEDCFLKEIRIGSIVEEVIPFEGANYNWGLLNTKLDTLLPPIYDNLYLNNSKWAYYKKYVDGKGMWGLIDTNYSRVTKPQYRRCKLTRNDSLFIFQNMDDQWGILNLSLDTIFRFEYQEIKAGKQLIFLQDKNDVWHLYRGQKQFTYIDSLQDIHIPFDYQREKLTKHPESFFYKTFEGKWGAKTFNLETILKPRFDTISKSGKYLALGGSYVYDAKDKIIIAGRFAGERGFAFKERFFTVSDSPGFKVLNYQGQSLFNGNVHRFDQFNDSLFIVRDSLGRDFLYHFNDQKRFSRYCYDLNPVSNSRGYSNHSPYLEFSKKPWVRYYNFFGLNQTGSSHWISHDRIGRKPNQFLPPLSFKITRKNKTGVINLKGEVIVQPNYQQVHHFQDNIWLLKKRPLIWPLIKKKPYRTILKDKEGNILFKNLENDGDFPVKSFGNHLIVNKEDYHVLDGEGNILGKNYTDYHKGKHYIYLIKDDHYDLLSPTKGFVGKNLDHIIDPYYWGGPLFFKEDDHYKMVYEGKHQVDSIQDLFYQRLNQFNEEDQRTIFGYKKDDEYKVYRRNFSLIKDGIDSVVEIKFHSTGNYIAFKEDKDEDFTVYELTMKRYKTGFDTVKAGIEAIKRKLDEYEELPFYMVKENGQWNAYDDSFKRFHVNIKDYKTELTKKNYFTIKSDSGYTLYNKDSRLRDDIHALVRNAEIIRKFDCHFGNCSDPIGSYYYYLAIKKDGQLNILNPALDTIINDIKPDERWWDTAQGKLDNSAIGCWYIGPISRFFTIRQGEKYRIRYAENVAADSLRKKGQLFRNKVVDSLFRLDNYRVLKKNGYWTIYNKQIKPVLDKVEAIRMTNHRAATYRVKKNDTWAVYDDSFKLIEKGYQDYIGQLGDKAICAIKKNGYYRIYNHNLEVVFEQVKTVVKYVDNVNYAIKKGDRWKLIDKDDNSILNEDYELEEE